MKCNPYFYNFYIHIYFCSSACNIVRHSHCSFSVLRYSPYIKCFNRCLASLPVQGKFGLLQHSQKSYIGPAVSLRYSRSLSLCADVSYSYFLIASHGKRTSAFSAWSKGNRRRLRTGYYQLALFGKD